LFGRLVGVHRKDLIRKRHEEYNMDILLYWKTVKYRSDLDYISKGVRNLKLEKEH
jgi:hypothetical protein